MRKLFLSLMLPLLLTAPCMAQRRTVWTINTIGLDARDKRQHFIGGVLAAQSIYWTAKYFDLPHPERFGWAAAIIVGILKEIYDLYSNPKRGEAEIMDAFWAGMGGVTVTVYSIKW